MPKFKNTDGTLTRYALACGYHDTRAIECIAAELGERSADSGDMSLRDYVNRNIVSLPLSEWDESPAFGGVPVPPGAWLHFAEYRIN